MTTAELDILFSHHPPTGDQVARYELLRHSAQIFAAQIIRHCPAGADRSAAIRKVREAVMTANAAIACGEVPA